MQALISSSSDTTYAMLASCQALQNALTSIRILVKQDQPQLVGLSREDEAYAEWESRHFHVLDSVYRYGHALVHPDYRV